MGPRKNKSASAGEQGKQNRDSFESMFLRARLRDILSRRFSDDSIAHADKEEDESIENASISSKESVASSTSLWSTATADIEIDPDIEAEYRSIIANISGVSDFSEDSSENSSCSE